MARCLVAGLALVLVAACGGSNGVSADEWGLATVDMPQTIEEIAVVFAAMPDEVAGYPRVGEPAGEHLVEYGFTDGMSIFVQGSEHRTGADGEVMSPGEVLAEMATGGELDVIDSALDGDPVWLHAATIGEDTEYFFVCGEAGGEFMFTFDSSTEAGLDALIDAFVATVNG